MHSHPCAYQRGFTLIEILVVLIIIGLLTGLAVAGLSTKSHSREVKESAYKLLSLMRATESQSVSNNQEIGLTLSDEGYQFLVYESSEKTWLPSTQSILKPGKFPESMKVIKGMIADLPRLSTREEDDTRPDVVFFSSGDHTPFRISFLADTDKSIAYVIQSDGVSEIQWLEISE